MFDEPHPAQVAAGLVLGTAAFVALALGQERFDPAAVGLGRNTFTRIADRGDLGEGAISGLAGDLGGVRRRFMAARARDLPVALWLGASQLHAINRLQPEDRLAVEHAERLARARRASVRFVQASTPNASLHDLLALYLGLRQQGLVPDVLIVALVYDDLREGRVQDAALAELSPIRGDEIALGGAGVRNLRDAMVEREANPEGAGADAVARNAVRGTPQEWLEDELIAGLERAMPGYRFRDRLTAKIEVTIRGTFARAAATFAGQRRERRVPAATMAWNGEALASLLRLARADGARVLLYKQPHRPSSGPFYHDRARYDRYFAELERDCAARPEVELLDLERLVPESLWGRTHEGRPDVFHFRGEGHRRLGERIGDVVLSRFDGR